MVCLRNIRVDTLHKGDIDDDDDNDNNIIIIIIIICVVFSYTFPRDVTTDTRQYIFLSLFVKTHIIYVVTCYIGLSGICRNIWR
jgi:hypothetical protein